MVFTRGYIVLFNECWVLVKGKNVEKMIHLAIAFDQNYLQQFYALLSSILENTKKRKLRFHLISPDLSEIEKEHIQSYIDSQNAESIFYTLNENTFKDLVLTGKWTHAV